MIHLSSEVVINPACIALIGCRVRERPFASCYDVYVVLIGGAEIIDMVERERDGMAARNRVQQLSGIWEKLMKNRTNE